MRRRTFDRAPCLWCGSSEFRPSLEHILPESLGCPPGFVLENDICAKCNNGLAHLDRAMLRQFEMMAFLGNVPRKGGKRPSLDSWASTVGRYTDTGPEVHINGGPGDVEAMGRTLKSAPSTKELENISFEKSGCIASLSFTQRFGDDPKFIRALYKVAISITAFWLGPEVAGGQDMAAARKFVRKGRGAFKALLLGSSNRMDHHFTPPWKGDDNPYLAVGMRVLGVDFVVDFDPEQRLIAMMEKLLIEQEAENWTTLPVAP